MTTVTCEMIDQTKESPAAPRGPLPHVLNVIFMDPSQKFGSMEEQLCLLAQHFRAAGSLFLPLFVCSPGPNKTAQFAERGVAAVCLDLRRFRWSQLFSLLGILKRHRIRVIHWNFTHPLNKYVWALTFLAPFVQHYFTDHNSRLLPIPAPPRGLTRWVKRLLLGRYRKVVGVSRYVLECLQAQGTWSNLTYYLHFINTERFRPDEAARLRVREQLDASNRFVLLTVAHLIPEKGVDVALRALAELPPQVVLWVVGIGREAENLAALSADLGLTERVRFLGLQRHVEPFMQAADCFVCPSRWAEAAGLVNLEAQGCGLPVVASNIGGIPEYVAEGESGWLFPPNDPSQLAERVRRLVEQPALHQQLRQQARNHVVTRFAPENRIQDFLDLYRAIL